MISKTGHLSGLHVGDEFAQRGALFDGSVRDRLDEIERRSGRA